MAMSASKHIPLETKHIDLGARMVPYHGFLMPIQYAGIKEEHHAVRTQAGLFDVSHMGEIEVVGPDATSAVDALITNDLSRIDDGQALYTVMCNPDGGIIDDVIVYRLAYDHIFICVNAGCREKDFQHIQSAITGNVEVIDSSDSYAQLAIQGPTAESILQELVDCELTAIRPFQIRECLVAGSPCMVARTGYTGEDGFEIYIPADYAEPVFDAFMSNYHAEKLTLCGLGCRDTLRLEAKFNLYGQDMDEQTNPYEAGLGWVVKLDKESSFIGKNALQSIKNDGITKRLVGLVVQGRQVIRPGYPIFHKDEQIGMVTSGSFAPTLSQSIGLGYVDSAYFDEPEVEVEVRSKRVPVAITKKPFYRRTT